MLASNLLCALHTLNLLYYVFVTQYCDIIICIRILIEVNK